MSVICVKKLKGFDEESNKWQREAEIFLNIKGNFNFYDILKSCRNFQASASDIQKLRDSTMREKTWLREFPMSYLMKRLN